MLILTKIISEELKNVVLTVGIIKAGTAALLKCQYGIGGDGNLLAQLTLHSSVRCNGRRVGGVIANGTTTSSKGIVTTAIHRLTFAEANAYVTLEANVVAGGEFKGIKAGQQTIGIGIVFPVAKDVGVCGTAVLIRNQILVLYIILHGLGDAGSREATIDS